MRFSSPNKPEDDATLDMTPMIDIVFQLLIFFMVTTTFSQASSNTSGIEVNLPKATTKEVQQQADDIVVALTTDGKLIIDGAEYRPDQLRDRLTALSKSKPGASVIVQADISVHHGKVVEIMDIAKSAGIQRIGIATLSE
jgi:biopolymer transport protein ExbD